MGFLAQRRWWVWLGLALILGAGLYLRCFRLDRVFTPDGINFVDPDCYTRMARVREIREQHGLPVRWHHFEGHPTGIRSHATAPLDYLILGAGLVLRPYTPRAWDLAGAWISPALGLLGALWLWRWTGRYFNLATRFWMLLAYAVLPGLAWSQNVGRPDHQSLLLLLLLIAVTREIDLWRNPSNRRWQITGGLAWGFALWTSLFEPGALFLLVILVQLATRRLDLFRLRPLWWVALVLTLLTAFLVEGNPIHVPDPKWRPYLMRWFESILELAPTDLKRFTLYTGLWFWVLPVTLFLGFRAPRRDARNLILFAVLTVALVGLSFWQVRWLPYASLFVVLLAVPLLLNAPGSGWQGVVAVILCAPMAIHFSASVSGQDTPSDSAALRLLARRIARDPGGILAPGGIAPELMYFSGCPVVASCSHENIEGIIDTAYVWADTNWTQVARRLSDRKVRWVVAYRAQNLAQESAWLLLGKLIPERAFGQLKNYPDFIGTRLANNDRVPRWLRFSGKADDLMLYEFVPGPATP